MNAANLTDGNTPLHLASQFGRTACVQWLLGDARTDAGVRNRHGKTALELAAQADVRQAFEALEQHEPPPPQADAPPAP